VRDHLPFAYPLKYAFFQYRFSRGSNKKIDLYHEPNYLTFKSEIPTVITVHDVSWITYPEVHPASRVREMNRYFKACLRQAQHIITDSEFVKKEFIKYFAYQKNKVTAIPLGVDGSFRPRSLEETRNTLNKYALTYTKYFLLLGTLEPRKNLIVVINEEPHKIFKRKGTDLFVEVTLTLLFFNPSFGLKNLTRPSVTKFAL
jgi:alpha-1,3-rhamnosyl/mannosyltransferase